MTTDPYLLQQLVHNHRRDLVDAAQQSRLRRDVAVTQRAPRPHIAWRGWRLVAARSAAAH